MTGTQERPRPVLAWTALAVVYVLWGSTFMAIRVGVRSLPPATFAGARFVLAGAALYAVAIRTGDAELRRSDRPGRRQWLACAVVGTLLLGVGNGGVTLAEQHLDSGLAAVLVATIPLWMIVFAALGEHRWPRPARTAGVLCGLGGVAVLASGGGNGGHAGSVAVALVAAIGWALGSVLAGRLPLPRRILLSAAMQMLAGGAVLLVAAGTRGEYGHVHVDRTGTDAWLAFAWLVVAGSILAFSAYGYALSHLPLATVSTYAYVNPVIAVLLGVAFLGERLELRAALGALIIVASVGMVVRPPPSGPRRPTSRDDRAAAGRRLR